MRPLPVAIPVRDRLGYLMALLAALHREDWAGVVHLFDMDSSYPPMLEFLERPEEIEILCGHKVQIHYLRANLGARGLFQHRIIHRVIGPSIPFVLTDPDVVPERGASIRHLKEKLNTHRKLEKVGLALRIDDIPDRYPKKAEVQAWEARWWKKPLGPALWDADVATTFCVVRAAANLDRDGNGRAARSRLPWVARHLSWYEDPCALPEDVRHYYDHAPRRRAGAPEPGVSWSPL